MKTPTHRRRAALAGLGLIISHCASGGQALGRPITVADAPGVKRVAAADTDFSLRMLRQLTKTQASGNVFFSPFSVSSALQMTLNGAGGQTERDMAQALGLAGLTRDQINAANGRLLPSLSQPDPKVRVSVANALWANHGVTLAPDFVARCRRFYGARAETLDLASPAAVGAINGWVKANTGGRITRLVTHGDIAQAPAVLTNAVYFHGKWQSPFEKNDTETQPFHLTSKTSKKVPLMNQQSDFPYAETPQFQAAGLPYGSGRMSLLVVLPRPGRSVESVVKGLDAATWRRLIASMKPKRLDLSLPRFQADYEAHLRGPLSALGMASAFGGGADFGPMGLRGAGIGDVIHKAVLQVDESGTVAAAATGTIMVAGAVPLLPAINMRVDHPFLLAIRDNSTGVLLFAGVIRDPE